MFAPDVRFEGFDYRDWQRLWGLWRASRRGAAERTVERNGTTEPSWRDGLVAVHRHGEIVKLVHTVEGRLTIVEAAWQAQRSTAELARHHRTRWALRLEYGALERTVAAFGARLQPRQQFTEQALGLLDALHGEFARGGLDWAWADAAGPRWLGPVLRAVRQPAAFAAMRRLMELSKRLLDAVWPVGCSVLFGAFDGHALATALVLQRGDAGIDRVLGPARLRPRLGELEGQLHADHRRLCAVAEQQVGPLALACSASVDSWQAMLAQRRFGDLARARAAGRLSMDPVPAGLEWLLALDSALGRLGPPPPARSA